MKGAISVLILVFLSYVQAQRDTCDRSICFRGNEACFEFGTASDTLTWYDAVDLCQSKGLFLATFETQRELDIMTRYFRQCVPEVNHFWIGGMGSANTFEFKWNSTGLDVTLTNWGSNQPAYKTSNDHCIEVHSFTGDIGLWSIDDCASPSPLKSYICRK